ncbi:hypothetical protein BpHYR1_015076 [Brachionus plicatilis]|uniref:Uncharacterized protein n=1 Tax=Brachionus plicatilis TaxID=10195 RepID=A0A3M7SN60_BRAPC|nr:hypothetical protein BpHYR1_015076 [Brachionus plicatilis]
MLRYLHPTIHYFILSKFNPKFFKEVVHISSNILLQQKNKEKIKKKNPNSKIPYNKCLQFPLSDKKKYYIRKINTLY